MGEPVPVRAHDISGREVFMRSVGYSSVQYPSPDIKVSEPYESIEHSYHPTWRETR